MIVMISSRARARFNEEVYSIEPLKILTFHDCTASRRIWKHLNIHGLEFRPAEKVARGNRSLLRIWAQQPCCVTSLTSTFPRMYP